MTPTVERSQLVLLIVLLLLSIITTEGTDTPEQSVFANHYVTFSTCCEDCEDVQTFTINGQYPWSFAPEFQSKLTFEKGDNSCQILTFPALLKFDNATITFILTDGTEISFLLHVQGILISPDLTYKDVNSTHITLKWDEPFSWVHPGYITYILSLIGTDTMTVRLRATSFTISRPHDVLSAVLTAWNTVGEGERSILNVSFAGCEQQGEIMPRALPYQELGEVSVYMELFTLQESTEYCLPDNIIVVHDNIKKAVKIMYNKNKAHILLHNVTEPRHMTDLLIWYRSQLHLHYSTYKVQDVSVTGDSYKKVLQCHFLNGTEHNTCFIEVEGDDWPLSGSDVYNFSKPGNHTLRVYDNRAQRDVGAKPANVINITIGDVPTEKTGEGGTWKISVGIVGVCVLLLFLLAVGLLLLHYKHTHTEVPTLNEDKAENNDSQQHGSAVDDRANVVHQETG
jgi:hypothetical protein